MEYWYLYSWVDLTYIGIPLHVREWSSILYIRRDGQGYFNLLQSCISTIIAKVAQNWYPRMQIWYCLQVCKNACRYTLGYVGFKKNLLKKVQFHHLISLFFPVKHRLQAKRLLEIIQARKEIAFTVWLTLIVLSTKWQEQRFRIATNMMPFWGNKRSKTKTVVNA